MWQVKEKKIRSMLGEASDGPQGEHSGRAWSSRVKGLD